MSNVKDTQQFEDMNHTSNLDAQSATNVKNHIGLVNVSVNLDEIQIKSIINTSGELLITYKHEIDQLKQELHLMKQRIINNNEEIKNTTTPTLDAMLRDLRQAINAQKDENSKLQSQITELKKEKAQVQQLIISCTQKLAQLESQVGAYS